MNVKLYVDGEEEESVDFTGIVGVAEGSDYFTLGVSHAADGSITSQFFDGLMDDVRIYKHSISQAEIKSIVRGDAVQAPSVVNLEDCEDVDDLAAAVEGDILRYDGSAWAHQGVPECIIVACTDEGSDISAQDSIVVFNMPYKMVVTEVKASVTNPPTGASLKIAIRHGAFQASSGNHGTPSDIFYTGTPDVEIAADEYSSASDNVTHPVFNPSGGSTFTLAEDDDIHIDVNSVGSTNTGNGLKVYIKGYRTA